MIYEVNFFHERIRWSAVYFGEDSQLFKDSEKASIKSKNNPD